MTVIEGTYKNGQVILDAATSWPEGSRVRIELLPAADGLGMTEEEQGDDPESIARWLAEFEAIPPLQMTGEEEAAWQAARQAQRDYELARFEERGKRIEGLMP